MTVQPIADSAASDATAVHPRRHTLTLVGGRKVDLAFTMETLWLIEEAYGSLDAYAETIQGLAGAEASKQQVIIPIMRALAVVMPDEDLQDPRRLVKLIPLDGFEEVAGTLVAAFGQAVTVAPDGRPNGLTTVPLPDSPGEPSTTPAPSSSAAQTSSSGG